MKRRASSSKSERNCFKPEPTDGYSIRINAFYLWLRKNDYTAEFIADALNLPPGELIIRLEKREKFHREELRKLIYLRLSIRYH